MNNKEVKFSILFQIFLKKKLKTIFIVIISIIVIFCYNYSQPDKFRISANFVNNNFPFNNKKELNSIANSDHLNLYIKYIMHQISIKIISKFDRNINKVKPLKISILKQNFYVKKNINHLTIKKQKKILNTLSSSIIYAPPKLSLIYHNEEEGKKILNDLIITTFEKSKNSILVDIIKNENEITDIIKDIIKNENEITDIIKDIIKNGDITRWLTYDQSKIYTEKVVIDKKFNFFISTLISLIFGFIYILYIFYLNEIAFTKANLKK
tara:strand:+ start:5645 stop:6445 length:801 start_codon:yes stop_codon:yes gene_type:complete